MKRVLFINTINTAYSVKWSYLGAQSVQELSWKDRAKICEKHARAMSTLVGGLLTQLPCAVVPFHLHFGSDLRPV